MIAVHENANIFPAEFITEKPKEWFGECYARQIFPKN